MKGWLAQIYNFGPMGSWWRQCYSFGPNRKLVEIMLLHDSSSTGGISFKERLINPMKRLTDDYSLLHFRKLV